MDKSRFVSRGGEKLEAALQTFQVDVNGKICADFGSSVGGFTDCLLQHNAQKVYSVDTGYGELAWELRNNPKVIVLERTNAMHVKLPEQVDLITIDTSWTKQKNIMSNVLNNLKENGSIITLIKPHYEADKKFLHHGKVDEDIAEKVVEQVLEYLTSHFNLTVKGYIKSPITGSKGGNIEYLAYLVQ